MTKRYSLSIILFAICITNIYATVNSDSIFDQAIVEAKNKQYSSAISTAKKALSTDSTRGDFMVFIANVYSWQEMNDSALIYLQKAENIHYYKDEFFDASLNILLRSHQYNTLLEKCSLAEQHKYSNTENILEKRLIAYTGLKEYKKGVDLVETPENKPYIQNKTIDNLYTNLLLKRCTNILTAFYTLDFFNTARPQHLGSLGYSFHVNQHTLALRTNYAYRFGQDDIQIESDFYLQMKNNVYMYFNYGYAFKSLFPNHRAGYELYFPMNQKMEASVGARYMYYPNSQVLIATGHFGKYFGNQWIALRPFLVTQKNVQSLSVIGDYRYYTKNELNYWGVELGYGNSPDNTYATIQNNTFNQLDAYKIKIERNFSVNRISDIHIGMGYTYEEFRTNTYRNHFIIELGYKLRTR